MKQIKNIKSKQHGDGFDSEDEDAPGKGDNFLTKQDSANLQNINGQEFDVIDGGEQIQP